jgi:hypothetical protein
MLYKRGTHMKKNIINTYLHTVSDFMHGKEKSAIKSWRLIQRPFVSQSHLRDHKRHVDENQFISDATLLSIKGEQLLIIIESKLNQLLDMFDTETKKKIQSIMLPDDELMWVLGDKTSGNIKFTRLDFIVNKLMFYNKQLIAAEKELKRIQSETLQPEMKQELDLTKNNKRKGSPLVFEPEKAARIEAEHVQLRKRRPPPLYVGMKKKSSIPVPPRHN